MQLNYQISGSGEPLVILHGLFGTLENWGAQIKALSEHFTVIAVDLRNHGRSPHSDDMSYPLMSDDVIELLDELNLNQVLLMGHSMGGKVAMQLAMNHPERLKKLIVVDISPVVYEPNHDDVFAGLFSIQLDQIKSRSEADKQLSEHVKDLGVRAFLLKNLYRNEEKAFAWRMNLEVLHTAYNNISQPPSGQPYAGDTLFIKGENSNYITAKYTDAITSNFPAVKYKMIQGAGHWPHAEKPTVFTKLVTNFLKPSQH